MTEEVLASTAIAADLASIKRDFDDILPSLLVALKREKAFEEVQRQLREAQSVAAAWRDWPLIEVVHEAIIHLRALPCADHDSVVRDLINGLARVGVVEFGLPGEQIRPEDVEIVACTGDGVSIVVTDTHRPGLRISHIPLRKPIVAAQREGVLPV